MERFEGNHPLAAFFGLSGAFVLALVAYVIIQAAPQFPTLTLPAVFGLGVSGAAGLLLLYGAREAAASFVVDENGITRRVWGHATALAWGDVVRLQEFYVTSSKEKPGASGRCVLFDATGRRLVIHLPWVSDSRRLCALLEPRLTLLREAQLRDLIRHGARFRPGRTAGIVVLICVTPIFLICGLKSVDSRGAGGDPWTATWLYVGIILVASALALLGTELISRELAITADSLALRSLFLDRTIPFAQIESISVKVSDAEEPGIDHLIIRGHNGQTIVLDSGLPCYHALLHLLRTRANGKPSPSTAGDREFS